MLNKLIVIIVFNAAGAISCFGQKAVREISPVATQPTMAVVHGNHLVSSPDHKKGKNKLLISMAGTGSSAEGLAAFDSVGNALGFHTISLDYKNEVVTTVCRASFDSSCFDSFRQEIVFGTPVSDTVRVDSTNSLYNRIYRLLEFLSAQFPKEGWASFFQNRKIVWANITVAGHSQGAGHAAFLGKHFLLSKVIILAGPQDFLDYFNRPAPWINREGKTPPERYVALLHQMDPYGFEKQLASCLILSQTQVRDTVSADQLKSGSCNIMVTHVKTKNPHGSVVQAIHADAWKYLLER